MRANPRPQLICFSTADWDAPLWTNKQHLMDRLARTGVGIVYVESLGLRAPGVSGEDLRRIVRRLRRWRPFAEPIRPGLWRDSPLVVPRQSSERWRSINSRLLRFRLQRNQLRLGFRKPLLVWTYNPTVADFVPAQWPIIYHCVDDLASYPGIDPTSFRSAEQAIVRLADVCIASSRPLVAHLKELGATDVKYWPNPADVEPLLATPRVRPPGAPPVIGFVGAIQTHKVDLPLIAECARLRPNWEFRLVGPVGHGLRKGGADSIASDSLPANVQIHRAVPREALPDTLAAFSVGVIPYRINDYTRSVFPMKLFEYLASGLPVVSTPLPSLAGEVEHVRFADGPDAFVAALEAAIAEDSEPGGDRAAERRAYAAQHSWTARTAEAVELLRTLGLGFLD